MKNLTIFKPQENTTEVLYISNIVFSLMNLGEIPVPGTLDTPKWTVDNFRHMMEKLDGHEWTTLGGQWKRKAFRP